MLTFSTYRSTTGSLLLALLIAIAGITAGCDSSGATGNLLVPNTSTLDFQTTAGESDTLSVTLTYQDLAERPQPDELSSYYSASVTEESGSPGDGQSVFQVIFTAPEETGDYTEVARFRAGDNVTSIRLGGFSIGGPELITDFSSGEPGFETFAGTFDLSVSNEQLNVGMIDVGGGGVFPGMFTVFDQTTNFATTPVLAIRMKVRADSESPSVRVRTALNQAGDAPDANATVPDLLANVPADDEFRTYYFDFRDNFVQFDGQPVNPETIDELVLLFNDNIEPKFTGTLVIDSIVRRPDIPDDADNNAAPTAAFTFSPEAPEIGQAVTFTDNSTDPDGFIASYDWDFGDGSTAMGIDATNTYDAAGTYSVTLTVVDDGGATAQTTESVTVTESGGTTSELVFDDFEDGLQTDEYIQFNGEGAGIGLAEETTDLPAGSSSTVALRADISGGAGNGFAGFGKTKLVDIGPLGDTPHVNMYVWTTASTAFTLEVNLQEDQDGNGTFDGQGAVDDEFQYNLEVQPRSEYTLVSIPVSDFVDDNSNNKAGDGMLSTNILSVVFAIGGLDSADYSVYVDDITYTDSACP